MAGSVEVKHVGDIGVVDRMGGGFVNALRPIWGADDDEVVRIVPTNGGDHALGIGFYGFGPGDLERFVVDLVDDVRLVAVGLCHLAEERDRVFDIVFGVVVVPVNQHVDVVGDGGVDEAFDFGNLPGGLLLVSEFAIMDPKGGASQGDVPILDEPINGFGGVEFAFPLAPKVTQAVHRDRFAVIAHDLIAVGLEAAVFTDHSGK